MKYRLKDQELQKRLDAVCGGRFCFSARLQEECKKQMGDEVIHVEVFFMGEEVGSDEDNEPENSILHLVRIPKSKIEVIPEYDANDWNPWPQVTPPEGVLMRFEATYKSEPGLTYRHCAEFNVGVWEDDLFGGKIIASELASARFRPWDDVEKEE